MEHVVFDAQTPLTMQEWQFAQLSGQKLGRQRCGWFCAGFCFLPWCGCFGYSGVERRGWSSTPEVSLLHPWGMHACALLLWRFSPLLKDWPGPGLVLLLVPAHVPANNCGLHAGWWQGLAEPSPLFPRCITGSCTLCLARGRAGS